MFRVVLEVRGADAVVYGFERVELQVVTQLTLVNLVGDEVEVETALRHEEVIEHRLFGICHGRERRVRSAARPLGVPDVLLITVAGRVTLA